MKQTIALNRRLLALFLAMIMVLGVYGPYYGIVYAEVECEACTEGECSIHTGEPEELPDDGDIDQVCNEYGQDPCDGDTGCDGDCGECEVCLRYLMQYSSDGIIPPTQNISQANEFAIQSSSTTNPQPTFELEKNVTEVRDIIANDIMEWDIEVKITMHEIADAVKARGVEIFCVVTDLNDVEYVQHVPTENETDSVDDMQDAFNYIKDYILESKNHVLSIIEEIQSPFTLKSVQGNVVGNHIINGNFITWSVGTIVQDTIGLTLKYTVTAPSCEIRDDDIVGITTIKLNENAQNTTIPMDDWYYYSPVTEWSEDRENFNDFGYGPYIIYMPHRSLIIRVMADDTVDLEYADITVKGFLEYGLQEQKSSQFHIAGKIEDTLVYKGIPLIDLTTFDAEAYVPYGYSVTNITPVNIPHLQDPNYRCGDRIITITIKRENLPFYRDVATRVGVR
jgi:hypothetical protein